MAFNPTYAQFIIEFPEFNDSFLQAHAEACIARHKSRLTGVAGDDLDLESAVYYLAAADMYENPHSVGLKIDTNEKKVARLREMAQWMWTKNLKVGVVMG